MSEFIKLAGASGCYLHVRKSEIVSVRWNEPTKTSQVCDGDISDDHTWNTTETPEQIMALIDGPADRDALVDDLVVAVRNCIVQIRRLHSEFQETDDGKMVMYHAQRVIDRAEFPS